MSLREELHHHRDAVRAIAIKHGASNVRLFSSAIRGDEGPDSDIDLLIDMDENRGFADYRRWSRNWRACLDGASIWS